MTAKNEDQQVMSAAELHKAGQHSSLIIGEQQVMENQPNDDESNKVTEHSSASVTVVNPAANTYNQKSESNAPLATEPPQDAKTNMCGPSIHNSRIEESKKEDSASMVTD